MPNSDLPRGMQFLIFYYIFKYEYNLAKSKAITLNFRGGD
ncbi:hypothetical protein CLOAM0082 [Candidatus Cloacimonas acidaminovorans str. Evry]|uniref:Uncharacterized protein n=1 Tax=Cloacimonas acidaminovorans (strain Evry) TaxID=459349 RepID=B0VIT6_CLOAI|nr:hypothetical protein CLOAM0082 [Candidatus Cloacimonas acidaminovorans str. Evry]